MLEQATREFDRFLQPAYAEEILALVTATTNFYFTRAEDDVVGELQGELWLRVLGDLPLHAIAEGCTAWLRESTRKRPTPGDILSRAMDLVRWDFERRNKLRLALGSAPPPPRMQPEEDCDPWMQARIKAGLEMLRQCPTPEQIDERARQIMAGSDVHVAMGNA